VVVDARGLRDAGPGSREVASLGVRIFLDSSWSVITVVMVLTAWTTVLDPVRPGR
jgi:hypothetical protein